MRMKQFLSGLMLLLLFGAFFGTAVYYQNKGIRGIAKSPPFYETWQLKAGRSSEMLRLMSGQYDQLMADFLWLRSIQSFGGRGMTNRDWRPIYNMFDVITDLDPYFENAYSFGNLVIGDEANMQREGLKLLHKGTFKIYKAYRLPFEGMYVAHWSMHDIPSARWYGRLASKRQDSPDWVPRMTAFIDVQSGEYFIGFDRFVGNLLRSLDDQQPSMQTVAFGKILETVEKWNISQLVKAADEYTSRTGKQVEKIDDLADMPALKNYQTADLGKLVTAVERYASAMSVKGLDEGIVNYEAPALLPIIKQALDVPAPETTATRMVQLQNVIFQEGITTRSGIPLDPYQEGYIVNKALAIDPDAKKEDRIARPSKVKEYLQKDLLPGIRNYIAKRKFQLGRNPRDMREVFYTDFNTPEPFGGQWIYNPETGEFKSSTHPEW